MRYTIAIPTHNNSIDDLERCILSAVEVRYSDCEIVISDTSDTKGNYNHIMNMIDENNLSNVRIYHNDSNWSMWDNHNYLVNQAAGDYIFFLHSDDIVLEHAIEDIDAILKSHNYPNKIMIAGCSIYKDFQTTLKELDLPTDSYICGSRLVELFMNDVLTPSGMLFSKDIEDIGGFIANSMIIPCSDCWTELNCALNGFRLIVSNNIFFIRDSNGTKLRYGTDEEIKAVYERLKPYFHDALAMVIINASLKTNSWHVLKHFTFDEKYKKYIMKHAVCRFFLHPYKNRRIRRLFYWHGKIN